MKRVGDLKKIYLLPNFVTTCCLFAGSYSITQSLVGNYIVAAWAILVASVFDGLDGRLARLTGSESEFGVQYDSLSDLVSFGVAPAILAYSWTLHSFHGFGIMGAFLFIVCAALRLARYNVQFDELENSSFNGLPVPAAAGMLTTLVIFYTHVSGSEKVESYLTMGLTVMLAVLMVSGVKYPSFKGIDFKKRSPFHYLLGAVAMIAIIALEPRITLFVFGATYVTYGLIGNLISFQGRRAAQEAVEKANDLEKKTSGKVKILQMGKSSMDTDPVDSEQDD